MEENNAPNGSNSVDNHSSTHESGGTTNSARKSYRKRKRSTNIGDTLPLGRKLVIGCNDDFCQPNKNDEATIAFSTKVGVVARRDIPICFTDWRLVPSTIIENVVKCLGKYFEFDYQESIDTTYTGRKLNVMWKNYKHELYEEHVKDKNPRFVRENPPPDSTIPLEDWQTFVANCNTQAFKESSERNTESREKQTLPSCSGRKLASVVRNEIADAKGVPEYEVGRSETYIALHTRKDKSLQCPELVDDLNTYMAVHPESRETAVDDALMHTRGACSRGRFLGVGLGVSKSQVRLSEATRKKNTALQETNKELRSTITNMGTMNYFGPYAYFHR